LCHTLQAFAAQNAVYPVCILYHNPGIKTPADWTAATSVAIGACLTYSARDGNLTAPPQISQFQESLLVSH